MKMTQEHYKLLKDSIISLHNQYPEAVNKMKQGGYSNARILWDHYWGAKHMAGDNGLWDSSLYLDNHIYTALIRVFKELNISL